MEKIGGDAAVVNSFSMQVVSKWIQRLSQATLSAPVNFTTLLRISYVNRQWRRFSPVLGLRQGLMRSLA